MVSQPSSNTDQLEGLMDTEGTNREKQNMRVCTAWAAMPGWSYALRKLGRDKAACERSNQNPAAYCVSMDNTQRGSLQPSASHFPQAAFWLDHQLLRRFLTVSYHQIQRHNTQVLTLTSRPTPGWNNLPSSTVKEALSPSAGAKHRHWWKAPTSSAAAAPADRELLKNVCTLCQ